MPITRSLARPKGELPTDRVRQLTSGKNSRKRRTGALIGMSSEPQTQPSVRSRSSSGKKQDSRNYSTPQMRRRSRRANELDINAGTSTRFAMIASLTPHRLIAVDDDERANSRLSLSPAAQVDARVITAFKRVGTDLRRRHPTADSTPRRWCAAVDLDHRTADRTRSVPW